MGFFVTGVSLLLTIYLGLGGLPGALLAVTVTMPFALFVMFGLKCSSCGVSYYFDTQVSAWNMTGVNLLRPVRPVCSKCGKSR